MTFNQTDFAHSAVIRGIFAEFIAKGGTRLPTRGKHGMFAIFNSRLPQPCPGNQNPHGSKFHILADLICSEFGLSIVFKQNAKRRSKKEYVLVQ